ncbi:MAG: hypothetical protein KAS32_03045 [Candidatus Peribacteraceae bacterium]|nr:hypothetical protein [Candidatus Peribacteraceae bacterium]
MEDFKIKFRCEECRDIFMSTPLRVFEDIVNYLKSKHAGTQPDVKLEDFVEDGQ